MVKSFARKCLMLQETRYLRKKFAQKLRRPFDPARARRFLCLQMNAIGDALMTHPAWAALKSTIPDAKVDLICRPHIAPLFRQDPSLDNIYPFETRKYHPWLFKDPRRLYDIVCQGDYDILIDFTALPLSAAVCATRAAPPSLGFSRRIPFFCGEIELGHAFDITFPYSEETPLRELMLHVVMPLLDPGTELKIPRIILAEEALEKAANALCRIGFDTQEFIVMHPGAKWPPKRWPIRHWISLIRTLKEEIPHPFIVLGGPGDKPLIQKIATDHVDPRVKPMILRKIDVAAAIIKKAALCVCNDSAPMHIAAAVGTPSVALFGPVLPKRSGPPPETHCSALYEGMFCSPCRLYYSRNRCRRGLNFCMFGIEPSRVIETTKKLIERCEAR